MAPRPALARIADRPDPSAWADDELVTLAEANALFFPRGPLTLGGLRNAIARGDLAGVSVNNRIYTTPGAIRGLVRLRTAAAQPVAQTSTVDILIERARDLRRRGRR